VLVFLVTLTSGLHYLVMQLNYRRDVARIMQLVGDAKATAWGPKLVPVEGKRKVKLSLGGPARMDEDGNQFGTRGIDVVVEGTGAVYLVGSPSRSHRRRLTIGQLEGDGSLTPLDASAALAPAVSRTWFIALCTSLARKAVGKGTPASVSAEDGEELEDESSVPGTPDSDTSGAVPRRAGASATSKVGGRRKVTKRR
jgi:DnaJ family protein C protein 1